MGSGKRASMREGPLAALFRKTEEQGLGTDAPKPEADSEQTREGARHGEQKREGARPGEQKRETGGTGPATPAAAENELRPAPPSQRHRPAPPPPSEADEPAEPPRVPTPEERLRNVFSVDIPENILERPAPERTAPRYGRETPRAPVQPGKVVEPVLKVVGVGGAGVNALNRMIQAGVEGVDFVAINTDLQSLQQSSAQETLHIGGNVTRGLGSGADPVLGRQAAMEEYDQLKAALKGSDMVFITAGAGGGTGTGAAPVVARIAREIGALVVGIVTKPFSFEGSRRADQAETGIDDLYREVDTLIVIPNSRLLSVLDKRTSMVDAFRMADDVLRQGVQGVSDLITLPGLINLDFADVRTIMSSAGQALLGIGMGMGDTRAMDAAQRAVESPLLETSVEGARSILLSITGGSDLSLWEVNEAAKAVAEAAHPDANIIFGAMVDEKVVDQVWVTVVATGFGDRSLPRASSGDRSGRAREPARLAAREADREPFVSRARESAGSSSDVDVPEFIPRGSAASERA
jgi:cell division protein FtsZ